MNDTNNAKDLQKNLFDFYNNGKFGKFTENELNSSLINKRVVTEEYFGTIKYVGSLPKSNGIWFGIDWDDASRGRHDGTHNGVKYFDTHSPKSGTFVRPNKVSQGLTIEEAINMRYGSGDEMLSNLMLDEFYLESSGSEDECGRSTNNRKFNNTGHQKVKVELSGPANCAFNINIGMMDKLKTLILHSLPIFRGMTKEEGGEKLSEMITSVQELDLAQTLLNDWLVVANICVQLPNLKNLTLSDNKFVPLFPIDDEHDCKIREEKYWKAFNKIKHLVLVRFYYTWLQFSRLFDFYPNIQHLCLAYNKLSNLDPPLHSNFTNLCYLDFACNEIEDFEKCILPFGQLKFLETLLLNENKLTEIILPGKVSESSDLFPSLKLLAISNNQLDSWTSIHHLDRLNSLRELIFMYNPILARQKNVETARQDVIAKLGRIKVLNRNDIKYEERKGAEIDYMKRYGKVWLEAQPKAGDDSELAEKKKMILYQFEQDHPRFLKLADMFGAPEDSEMKEVTRKLRDKLIEVSFEYRDIKNGSINHVTKKIPNHMTVQHLRNLLRRLCKIPGKYEFNLVYINSTRPDIQIPLEADTREIGFYNLQQGDKVIINLHK